MTTVPKPHGNRLAELDALRGIAAMMVVLFHFTWRFGEQYPNAPTLGWGLPWGKYGVELFFAVSGFVIFMTLENTRTASDFIVSRFSRLFPAYWSAILLTIGITSIAGMWQMIPSLRDTFANFTMLQGYAYIESIDPVYWSLTVELSFYIVMLGLWRLKLLDRIEWVLAGWIAIKWLFWLVPALPSRLGFLLIQEYIPFFAIGILAYRVRSGERTWGQQVAVLVWAFVSVLVIDPPAEKIVYVAVAIVTALLTRPGALAFLVNPVTLWLGAISYPLYLLHNNIGFAVMLRLGEAGLPAPLLVIAATLLALTLATLVNRFIEKPSLAIIRDWWRLRKGVQTA